MEILWIFFLNDKVIASIDLEIDELVVTVAEDLTCGDVLAVPTYQPKL